MSLEQVRNPLTSVAATAALTIGMIGCSGGETAEPHDPQTNNESVTAPSTATTEALDTLITVPAGVEVQGEATVSALKDIAINTAYSVEDYGVVSEDDVAEARNKMDGLGNSDISGRGNYYIDTRLADGIDSCSFGLSADEENEVRETMDEFENQVELILDPGIKALADQALDLCQVEAVVREYDRDEYSENNGFGYNVYLDYVEDETATDIAELYVVGEEKAHDQLRVVKSDLTGKIEEAATDAFMGLYRGSNNEAESINQQIAEFNAARQTDGD